jgi:hypothetical protein
MSGIHSDGALDEETWERHKERIHSLYLVEGLKLQGPGGVMEAMATSYNFSPRYLVSVFGHEVWPVDLLFAKQSTV